MYAPMFSSSTSCFAVPWLPSRHKLGRQPIQRTDSESQTLRLMSSDGTRQGKQMITSYSIIPKLVSRFTEDVSRRKALYYQSLNRFLGQNLARRFRLIAFFMLTSWAITTALFSQLSGASRHSKEQDQLRLRHSAEVQRLQDKSKQEKDSSDAAAKAAQVREIELERSVCELQQEVRCMDWSLSLLIPIDLDNSGATGAICTRSQSRTRVDVVELCHEAIRSVRSSFVSKRMRRRKTWGADIRV